MHARMRLINSGRLLEISDISKGFHLSFEREFLKNLKDFSSFFIFFFFYRRRLRFLP